jgi:hypothetical protein
MCELHPLKCPKCKRTWTAYKKLASCESQKPNVGCPPSLCMWVGTQKKPTKVECDECTAIQEMLEDLDEGHPR